MAALFLAAAATPQAAVSLVPETITSQVTDRQDFQPPDRVTLSGWVGRRIEANE